MIASPPTPFHATPCPDGHIMVWFIGTVPRLTKEQAVEFANQLLHLAGHAPN